MMNGAAKKKIVVLVDWYLPGYKAGGPIQSVANMVARLKNDFEFAIITADTDQKETTPYPNVKSNEWNILPDGTRVYYFSKEERKFSTLKKLMLKEQADFFYLNSLFSVFFTMYPLIIRKNFLPSRKIILACRGMLGKGALDIKPIKKKIFIALARLTGLYRNITWHASTSVEAEEIRQVFGKRQKVLVATNLAALKNNHPNDRIKTKGAARFVYLSRIAPIKNLIATLDAINQVPDKYEVIFDIYGPADDAEYWEHCKNAIAKAPPHIIINYKGAVENAQAKKILRQYHFYLLQTHHENFGHSIIEAMAAGCVPIIGDQTPWTNLSSVKAGWDIPVAYQAELIHILKQCCEMEQDQFSEWSRGASSYAEHVINDPQLIEDNRKLFA